MPLPIHIELLTDAQLTKNLPTQQYDLRQSVSADPACTLRAPAHLHPSSTTDLDDVQKGSPLAVMTKPTDALPNSISVKNMTGRGGN